MECKIIDRANKRLAKQYEEIEGLRAQLDDANWKYHREVEDGGNPGWWATERKDLRAKLNTQAEELTETNQALTDAHGELEDALDEIDKAKTSKGLLISQARHDKEYYRSEISRLKAQVVDLEKNDVAVVRLRQGLREAQMEAGVPTRGDLYQRLLQAEYQLSWIAANCKLVLEAECADAKCDRAIARTALAEKTAECERLRHICRSARHGIEDTLEITDRSEITIMLSGLKDDLKEAE